MKIVAGIDEFHAAGRAQRKRPPEKSGGRVFIRCFMAINSYALFVVATSIVCRVV